jgi:3-deoxy-D-manno-octulosonic acid (KDO) 8-phosphate synthase
VDVLQTPAFLCRQTDFIQNVMPPGKPVNIKKGQFLSPWEMKQRGRRRLASVGNNQIMVCERGVSFRLQQSGVRYARIDGDAQTGCPVVFDATHSVQLPGGQGRHPAVSASLCRCWRGRQWRRASPGCSWRPIPIRPGIERWTQRLAAGKMRNRCWRR